MKLDNKYIGVPFVSGGRDFTGADCWGMAVLFYKEYFDIELPIFSNEYHTSETKKLRELIARNKEGWERVSKPQAGDLILFRVLGAESHVGIYIGNNKFLHSLENQASVIQDIDTAEWSRRIVGYYRYAEKVSENLPLALKTERVYCEVPQGTTISSFLETAAQLANRSYEVFADRFHVSVNGVEIPRQEWPTYKLNTDDIVQYRVVSEKAALRLVLTVVLTYVAFQFLGPGAFGLPGLGLQGATLAVAQIGASIAVSALVNAIFPIRPPEVNDPGTAKAQYLFNGGQNRINKYEAIPVVLGRVRITPPLAANPYAYDKTDTSYLRMLLCWGYGPVKLEDMCVGGTSIDQYITAGLTNYNTPEHGQDQLTQVFKTYAGGNAASDFEQNRPNLKLVSNRNDGTPLTLENSPWYEYTFNQEVDSIDVTLNFPQGLRKLAIKGESAGTVYETLFTAEIQYRLAGSGTWQVASGGRTLTTPWKISFSAPYVTVATWSDGSEGGGYYYTNHYFYQWNTVCLNPNGSVEVLKGIPTQAPAQEPNEQTLEILGYSRYTSPTSRPALKPAVPDGYVPLFRVCIHAVFVPGRDKGLKPSSISYERVAYEDMRDYVNWSYVGLTDTWNTFSWTQLLTGSSIAPGSASPAGSPIQFVQLGDTTTHPTRDRVDTAFHKRKDPFSFTKSISLPARARYEVRIRRTNSSWANPNNDPNSDFQLLHDCYLTAITGIKYGVPVIQPKNSMLALTAVDLQASDQINGTLEGINALVTTIALDYDISTTSWVLRETQNPASLFRYILEHPANAQRVKGDLSSQVHLADLEDWHTYCRENDFTYNDVITGQKSLLDVLRDIASAGRASPLLRDGKWTVVIDRARDNPVQYFTPHNSWGFESVRNLPQQPDAFRVIFHNEQKGFQEDEVICYNTGKTAENSELYQELRLPGITDPILAARHARWHLAQLKLRAETYSLSTDMEYLVCTRGDLVRVAHDVPMWGVATGRIDQYIDSSTLKLSEEVYLESGKAYTIRIRLANGTSVTRTLAGVATSDYYRNIILTSTITTTEGAVGNLFMLGELEQESQELIVIGIEPSGNYTARLTLVDYAPDLYTIEETDNITGLANEYPFPPLNSNITLPAKNLVKSIQTAPILQEVKSDESVLGILSPGVFQINMVTGFKTLDNLPEGVAYIEVHAKLSTAPESISQSWTYRQVLELPAGSAKFTDVIEGETYNIRARYLGLDGRTGPWSDTVAHTVIGKTAPPAQVSGFTYSVLSADGLLQTKWTANSELDLLGYEIRETSTDWGNPGYVWQGAASQADIQVPNIYTAKTYYIKAFDYSRNYSTTAATITFTKQLPNPVTNVTYSFGTTSNTNSTVTLSWTAPVSQQFQILEYVLEITKPGSSLQTVYVKDNQYIMPADWLGNAQVNVYTKDITGAVSSAATVYIPKVAPNPVSNLRAEIVDNNVLLRWDLPETTTLPVSHVLVKRGPTWVFPDKIIGEKDGTFTSVFELSGGTYQYWVAAVDTDDRESTPVSVAATVSQPPDFIFNGEYISTFDGTKTNCSIVQNEPYLLMLVDNVETWQQHFVNNAWAGPSNQVAAGYPMYSQPGTASAVYQETISLGTAVSSSSITISYSGVAVIGNPSIYVTIETKLNGGAWSSPYIGTSLFTSNFSDIRITVYANRSAVGDQYVLTSLSTRLDSKQVSDSGNVQALASDSVGTIVNFAREFIDVTSITCTAAGTTPSTVVYDFKDTITSATYTISGNVCTVTASAAHGLEVGQKVKLNIISGTGISNSYIVASKVSATVFTVNMVAANGSGSGTIYPQSMRLYAFNNSGTRVDTQVSWFTRGY